MISAPLKFGDGKPQTSFASERSGRIHYDELAVTTNFSFLRGASHPAELVETADALGLAAIGIADRNSFAGVVRAYEQWKKIAAAKMLRAARKKQSMAASRLRSCSWACGW